MAKLPRVTQKIFAQNSDTNDVTVFGTAKNGNDAVFTKDISQIMNSDAFSQGWGSATLTDDAPFQEDMNGVQLALSQQLAYFFENGMPEWDENTTYYANTSFCQVNGVWYQSLTDNNIGNNPVNDTTNWYKIDLDKLNPDLSNLSIPGLDKLNQSKALETGSVSSDADVYADIQKYAHSTFDLSKFKVVGNPTISDDGIASGFSGSNFIKATYIPLGQNFKIYSPKFNSSDVTITQTILRYSDGNVRAQIYNGKIRLFRYTDTSVYDLPIGSTSLKNNQDYYYYIEHYTDGEKYYLNGFISTDGINWSPDISMSSTQQMYDKQNSAPIQISGLDAIFPFIGTMDLKQFSIMVDGVPVFNGNKTGLYVAKSDNYTVEGSPTITDDGILTNCPSQNDYLSATIPSLSQFEKVRIEFELKVKEVPSSTRGIFNIPNDENPMTANSGTYAWLSSVGFNINLAYNGDSDNGTGSTAKYPIAIGDFIKVIAEGNKNSVGSIKVSKNNGVFNDLTLTQSNACNFQEATKLFLGITGVGCQMQSSAEFDINSFKIYGDGNLIYQPCLKIPYTEAFEHSKVVGVAYRNRVQDLYEQTGEALFYTIDEQNQNFTLPAGDIYGMITKNREILDIVYPIGRPMPEENNVLLDNEVWLEGATVNIVDYPKLFKVYGTKYGGDGTTTFKLPDMRGRTLWGSPDGSNGYIEAKLPNIKGSCGKFDVYEAGGEGCFNINSQTYGNTREQWGGTVAAIGFNASSSNSIYSDDATTVQPPAFKVRWKTRFE